MRVGLGAVGQCRGIGWRSGLAAVFRAYYNHHMFSEIYFDITTTTKEHHTILYIILYIARNVVFYCLLVTANNAKFLANFYFCFAVALKGLVCTLAVEHQIRYTKRVDLPTDVAQCRWCL